MVFFILMRLFTASSSYILSKYGNKRIAWNQLGRVNNNGDDEWWYRENSRTVFVHWSSASQNSCFIVLSPTNSCKFLETSNFWNWDFFSRKLEKKIKLTCTFHFQSPAGSQNQLPPSPYLLLHCHGGGYVATTSKSHEVIEFPYYRHSKILLC